MIETVQRSLGKVTLRIDCGDGEYELIEFKNTVINNGKSIMAQSLAGEIGSSFLFYACKIVFGNSGTIDGVPRFVDAGREGLFGPAVVTKNVLATIDPDNPTQVIFTAILTYDDAVDQVLNEMGLQLADGSFFSIATFGDITKTALMQITWQWKILFV